MANISNIKQQKHYTPYERFLVMFNSDYTRRSYKKWVKQFLHFCDFEEYDDLITKLDDNKKFELISEYLIYLKQERNVAFSTINTAFSAIKRFYRSNRVNLNWDHLTFYKGKNTGKVVDDRIYTKDEINQLLEHADLRMKVIILILLSTGIRIGALADLKIKDLEYNEEYKLYKMKIYGDSDLADRYITFCSPECCSLIKKYLEWRQQKGDVIKPDSPLVYRRKTMIDRTNGQKKIIFVNYFDRPLTSKSLQQAMTRLQKKANIIPDEKEKSFDERGRKRYEVMRCHNFRKIFNGACIKNNVNHYVKEMLLGHKKELELDRNYYRPLESQLLDEYIKVINDLTISEEHKLREENQKLKDRLETDFSDIKEQLEEIKERMERNN